MKRCALIAAVALFASAGCSSSVHPLLTEETYVHDINLNGTWKQIKKQNPQEQSPDIKCEGFDNHSGYDVTLMNPSKLDATPADGPQNPQINTNKFPLEYEMRIGKLGESHYLQVKRAEEGLPFIDGLVTYALLKVTLEEDVLSVYHIDFLKLSELLPDSGLAYSRRKAAEAVPSIVLTDSTEKLQQFFVKHHAELFVKDPLKYRREDKAP